MEKKLSELLEQRSSTADSLKSLDDAIKSVQIELVRSRGQALFESIFNFANLFTKGVVNKRMTHGVIHKRFEEIRQQLENLKAVDPNYLHTIGTADPYGQEGDEFVRYIIEQLLGSVWRSDATLWEVLGKVADTIDMKNNPFRKGNNRNGK